MTTYLFPGQGSQTKGMGGLLFDEFPQLTEQANSILGYSVKALCQNNENNQLNQTQYTQPALYVVNALSYQHKINATGLKPDYVVGHSLGEYNALQAADAISFEDGLKLVKKRGELMSQAPKGAMAAILGLSKDDILRCLEENGLSTIDIANDNAPTQTVISGLSADIKKIQAVFEQNGVTFIPLNTSGAFHSRYMTLAKTEFIKYLKQFQFTDLDFPVISNVDAQPYQQDKIAQNLAEQITHTVRWSQSIQYLLKKGETQFEELGVGEVLTKLVATIQEYSIETDQYRHDSRRGKTEQVEPDIRPLTAQGTEAVKTFSNLEQEREIDVLHKRIADWNKTYPIGTQVTVTGYEDKLKTCTKAVVLFGYRAAIYMEGYNGYFALNEVTPVGEYA